MPSLVEFDPVVLENILNSINVFSLFRLYLPLEMVVVLHLNKTQILFTQGGFVPSFIEIGTLVQEKKIFVISSMYFRYFENIFPWKRACPSFEH